jgi:hypothetical protein
MSGAFLLLRLLLALLVCTPAPVAAQTITAPGGVAAQAITNSPITFGLKPDEQLHLIEIFSQQNAASVEARVKVLSAITPGGSAVTTLRETAQAACRIARTVAIPRSWRRRRLSAEIC